METEKLRSAFPFDDTVFIDLRELCADPSPEQRTIKAFADADKSGRALLFSMRRVLADLSDDIARIRGIFSDNENCYPAARAVVRILSLLKDLPCRQAIGGVFDIFDMMQTSLSDEDLSQILGEVFALTVSSKIALQLEAASVGDRLFSAALEALAACDGSPPPLCISMKRQTDANRLPLIAEAVLRGAPITVCSLDSAGKLLERTGLIADKAPLFCKIAGIPGITAAKLTLASDISLKAHENDPESLVKEVIGSSIKPCFRLLKNRTYAVRRDLHDSYPLAPAALLYPCCIDHSRGGARDIFEGGAADPVFGISFEFSDVCDISYVKDILHSAEIALYESDIRFPARIVLGSKLTLSAVSADFAAKAIREYSRIAASENSFAELELEFSTDLPSADELITLIRGALGLGCTMLRIICRNGKEV